MDIHIISSVLAQMRLFRQRAHWTHQQLEAYQADALRSLRGYAYARSPFYQQFRRGCMMPRCMSFLYSRKPC